MNCEIVAVGTELLLGQIVDTNSAWIGEQLAAAGINSHFQTKVGDNWNRIADTLRCAVERSDAVIVTGGLGPTPDDITREVLADLMGVDLVLDPVIEQRIRAMFIARGRVMPENNLRQAMVPQGAKPIPEQPGTAPGLIVELNRAQCDTVDGVGGSAARSTESGVVVVYLVPGVPREMREMLEGTVLADLRARAGHTDVIASRVLRTWGESESGLAERLGDRMAQLDAIGNPTLAFLASGIEGIKVRITAKASSQAAATELLDAERETLCELLGDFVFSTDDESMEEVVLALLGECGLTLSMLETFTGGLMTSRLTEAQCRIASTDRAVVDRAVVDPIADVGSPSQGPFRVGLVLTAAHLPPDSSNLGQNRVNAGVLGAARHIALQMAAEARQMFGTDLGLGVASDEEGNMAVAVAGAEGEEVSDEIQLPGGPEQQRQLATITAFNVLRRFLQR